MESLERRESILPRQGGLTHSTTPSISSLSKQPLLPLQALHINLFNRLRPAVASPYPLPRLSKTDIAINAQANEAHPITSLAPPTERTQSRHYPHRTFGTTGSSFAHPAAVSRSDPIAPMHPSFDPAPLKELYSSSKRTYVSLFSYVYALLSCRTCFPPRSWMQSERRAKRGAPGSPAATAAVPREMDGVHGATPRAPPYRRSSLRSHEPRGHASCRPHRRRSIALALPSTRRRTFRQRSKPSEPDHPTARQSSH